MAIVWFEGFDHANSTSVLGYTNNGRGLLSGSNTPFNSGRCLDLSDNNSQVATFSSPALASSLLSFSFGMMYYTGSFNAGNRPVMSLLDSSNNQILTLFPTPGIGLQLVRGNVYGTSVIFTTDNNVFPAGAWHHLEITGTISASVGAIDIYVDGDLVYSGTGLNTGSVGVSGVFVQSAWASAGDFTQTSIDDCYIADAHAQVGPARVLQSVPTGDSSPLNFSTSSGSTHYTLVDEVPNSATDYVASATAGNKDTYTMGGVSGSPNIIAAQAVAVANKDDATTRALRLNVISASATDTGPTVAMTSSQVTMRGNVLNTDPNTSSQWTAANLAAAKLQIEVVT